MLLKLFVVAVAALSAPVSVSGQCTKCCYPPTRNDLTDASGHKYFRSHAQVGSRGHAMWRVGIEGKLEKKEERRKKKLHLVSSKDLKAIKNVRNAQKKKEKAEKERKACSKCAARDFKLPQHSPGCHQISGYDPYSYSGGANLNIQRAAM